LAAVSADAPGLALAHKAARNAHRVESALLWLGWRLQPRTRQPH
jgi:hypothetical protein